MQYKKQRKTRWWLILLFIPLLVGCNPVTEQLVRLGIYVGDVLIHSFVGISIESVSDYISDQLGYDLSPQYVIADPDNPLKGTSSKDLTFTGETANCQYRYTLKKPRMVRISIDEIWKPISEAQEKINKSFQEQC